MVTSLNGCWFGPEHYLVPNISLRSFQCEVTWTLTVRKSTRNVRSFNRKYGQGVTCWQFLDFMILPALFFYPGKRQICARHCSEGLRGVWLDY